MSAHEDRMTLALYRLQTAESCLNDAKILFEQGSYRGSANRSYYAIFHAIRATLAMEGLDFKKHSAVIGKFRELYIKTKLFSAHFSDVIGSAFIIRNQSDYDDFYVIEKQEVDDQITSAEAFIAAVKDYLMQ